MHMGVNFHSFFLIFLLDSHLMINELWMLSEVYMSKVVSLFDFKVHTIEKSG